MKYKILESCSLAMDGTAFFMVIEDARKALLEVKLELSEVLEAVKDAQLSSWVVFGVFISSKYMDE